MYKYEERASLVRHDIGGQHVQGPYRGGPSGMGRPATKKKGRYAHRFRRIGKGCASVFKTYSPRGIRESSENIRYKYFSVSASQKDSILSLNSTFVCITLLMLE